MRFTSDIAYKNPFIDVLYHQSSERHPGHTARAPPFTRGAKMGHFGRKTRPRGRARHVTSDATDSDAAGIDSGERIDACRAERSQLRSRKRALREQVRGPSGASRTSAAGAGAFTRAGGWDKSRASPR
jgi:hypothetical protein